MVVETVRDVAVVETLVLHHSIQVVLVVGLRGTSFELSTESRELFESLSAGIIVGHDFLR